MNSIAWYKDCPLSLILGLVLTISSGQWMSAQGPVNPLSLAEALAWGVDNNLAVAGQRLGVEVAARNNNWVSAGRNPVIRATLGMNNSINRQDNPASFINGSFYIGNATAAIEATYTLFNGYQVRFDRQRLGQLEAQSRVQLRQLIETAVFDVSQAYYNAQLEEARARLADQVLELSRDRVNYQELRRAYGQGQSVELLQARTAFLNDSVRVEQQRLALDNAMRSLYLALDASPETFEGRDLGDTLIFEPRAYSIQMIASRLDSAPTIQLLRNQEQLAATQTELARTAMKPNVNINGGLSFTENAFKFNGEDPRTGDPGELIFGNTAQGLVGIQAAYTIFDAGLRRRAIENAISQERLANLSLSNARRDAQLQARTLLETYRNQQQMLSLQDALIENARANLLLGDEQLKAGTINSFAYRDLQLQYLNAVQTRLNTVHSILITDLQLRRLSGLLVEG